MEESIDVQTIVQQAIDEYMKKDSARREPAYKTELQEAITCSLYQSTIDPI